MALLVGLGNVGAEYEGTRHNIGFEVVNFLAHKWGVEFTTGSGPFVFAEARYKGQNCYLVKPTNYMNNSGTSVTKAMTQFSQKTDQTLIIYDDLHLALGTIKLRPKGSDGGHNGIADVHNRLGSQSIPRLRIGIGNDFTKGRQVDFVLSAFSSDEQNLVEEAIQKAASAALDMIGLGITRAMNIHN